MKIETGKSYKTLGTNEIVKVFEGVYSALDHCNIYRGVYTNGGYAYWTEDGRWSPHPNKVTPWDLTEEIEV